VHCGTELLRQCSFGVRSCHSAGQSRVWFWFLVWGVRSLSCVLVFFFLVRAVCLRRGTSVSFPLPQVLFSCNVPALLLAGCSLHGARSVLQCSRVSRVSIVGVPCLCPPFFLLPSVFFFVDSLFWLMCLRWLFTLLARFSLLVQVMH